MTARCICTLRLIIEEARRRPEGIPDRALCTKRSARRREGHTNSAAACGPGRSGPVPRVGINAQTYWPTCMPSTGLFVMEKISSTTAFRTSDAAARLRPE